VLVDELAYLDDDVVVPDLDLDVVEAVPRFVVLEDEDHVESVLQRNHAGSNGGESDRKSGSVGGYQISFGQAFFVDVSHVQF